MERERTVGELAAIGEASELLRVGSEQFDTNGEASVARTAQPPHSMIQWPSRMDALATETRRLRNLRLPDRAT